MQIGGKRIEIDARDMLLKDDTLPTGMCSSAISDGGADRSLGPYVIGDPFFRSAVAVFDVGAKEMRFSERTD